MRNRFGSYLEQQILSASPLELTRLTYRTAIQAVRDARECLAQKNIPERVRCISLAHGLVAELYRSLDFKAGDGSLSRELGRLYDFVMRQLLEANFKQQDAPLVNALSILCSLSEAWEQIAREPEPPAAPQLAQPPVWEIQEMHAEQGGYSLSF